MMVPISANDISIPSAVVSNSTSSGSIPAALSLCNQAAMSSTSPAVESSTPARAAARRGSLK